MAQTATVTTQDIKKGNPRLCLSALRFTGSCHKCPVFEKEYPKGKITVCDSRIISDKGQQFIKNREKVKKLQQQISKIEETIKKLQEA